MKKHEELYAGAWKCEHEKLIFNDDRNELHIPNSPENRFRCDSVKIKTSALPGTTPKSYGEIFHQAVGIHDRNDADHGTGNTGDASLDHHNSISATLDAKHTIS